MAHVQWLGSEPQQNSTDVSWSKAEAETTHKYQWSKDTSKKHAKLLEVEIDN